MTRVMYDGMFPSVDVAGVRCEKGKPVDLPERLARELVARDEFKAVKATPKRAQAQGEDD